jgi:hypothetical protein
MPTQASNEQVYEKDIEHGKIPNSYLLCLPSLYSQRSVAPESWPRPDLVLPYILRAQDHARSPRPINSLPHRLYIGIKSMA